MGLGCSNLSDLESNEYLKQFCSGEALSPNDPIWNKLFSHTLRPVFTKDDGFMLDEGVESLRNEFMVNNLKTKNFTSLVKVFVLRAIELKSSVQTCDTMFIWQAYNALFMIRNLCKYFVETVGEDKFDYQFQTFRSLNSESEGTVSSENGMEDNDVLEMLMDSLVKIITELPVKSNTYVLHLESVNTLIILLSIQMYWTKPASKTEPFRVMMQGPPSLLAPILTRTLLNNYIDQRIPPQSIWHNEEVGSIVIGMANGIWNILRKGVGLGKTNDVMDGLRVHNLAEHSLYLLLILVNHCTNSGELTFQNPYREAITSFGNENVDGDDLLISETPAFKLNYAKLYNTICAEITTDDTTLLLYMLIHRNNAFKSYIMARSDIEYLVLPILKTLYNAPTSTSHHIYMSLIVMLILSEDELFNQQVHDIGLKSITWYTERNVAEISLGGLIVLVVIRTIQYNILKMRDKYLHTNCLAALANMSSKFRSLHPYVAQRLLSLFETLAKRHTKLLERLAELGGAASEQSSETVQDINVLEEVIRMVLEILNSVLTHQLSHNRHLVYTLLYKKQIFDSFRDYDATQDLVYNMDVVVKYFSKHLGSEHKDLSVSEVMEQIANGVLHWSPDAMRKFPDLKFRYVEEEEPEDFFIPYVWSLVYKNSGLYWSPINLNLFSSETDYLV